MSAHMSRDTDQLNQTQRRCCLADALVAIDEALKYSQRPRIDVGTSPVIPKTSARVEWSAGYDPNK